MFAVSAQKRTHYNPQSDAEIPRFIAPDWTFSGRYSKNPTMAPRPGGGSPPPSASSPTTRRPDRCTDRNAFVTTPAPPSPRAAV
jgi:hypothetical protein